MFEQDVIITGTHSKYIKILKDESGIFARNLDVYMLAPILGFIFEEFEENHPDA